jgi:hypothetical protein
LPRWSLSLGKCWPVLPGKPFAEKPERTEIIMTNEWFSDRLWVFKLTGTAKADRLLEIFAYARRRYGIDLFVIDNLAKCGLDEETTVVRKNSSIPCATSKTSITAMFCWLPMPEKQTKLHQQENGC